MYGAYSFLDKLANGVLLFFITANAINDTESLKWIIAIIPIACSFGALLLTYVGKRLYSDRLAKLSVGLSLKVKYQKD